MQSSHLYNKYRPKYLKDVVGQDHIIDNLLNMFRTNNFASSYMLYGPYGTGKTTVARIIAKAANCENLKDGKPCNSCESCKIVEGGNRHPDIIEQNCGDLRKIDDVRNIIKTSSYAPVYKNKVYILDEVHKLTPSAFTALLKPLENPNPNVIFILCTTETNSIPRNIQSRPLQFRFNLVDNKEIVKLLYKIIYKETKIKFKNKNVLSKIAALGEGHVRDSINKLSPLIPMIKDKDKKGIKDLISNIEKKVDAEISANVAIYVLLVSIYENSNRDMAFKVGVEYYEKLPVENPADFIITLLQYNRQTIKYLYIKDYENSLYNRWFKTLKDKVNEYPTYQQLTIINNILVDTLSSIKDYKIDAKLLLDNMMLRLFNV